VVLLDHCARKSVVSGLKLSLGEEALTIGSGRWFVFVVDLDHFGDVGLSRGHEKDQHSATLFEASERHEATKHAP
jgi:hypothetical protein